MLGNGMRGDEYGKSNIMNIYYDTPDYRIARLSLDKPMYKKSCVCAATGALIRTRTCLSSLKRNTTALYISGASI